jgi:hypothetical protein
MAWQAWQGTRPFWFGWAWEGGSTQPFPVQGVFPVVHNCIVPAAVADRSGPLCNPIFWHLPPHSHRRPRNGNSSYRAPFPLPCPCGVVRCECVLN